MEDASLTVATWLWLLIPMPLVVVLSFINLFLSKGDRQG
jgi:uncharacterized protein (DUF983 family)